MRKRPERRPIRKNDRKVLMAEESTKSWADSDSESSSNSSSSSDSEQEEVHCLMADQTSDDECFASHLFRQSLISYSSKIASSLISNSHHVDFDSVFGMDDATITQMFELLIAIGLKDFLGCPTVYYEVALIEFFENGFVREDEMVVSTIRGINVEISEGMFATVFGLPTEGLTDVSDVPKNLVFDARSLFSESEEQVSISCFKKEMKMEYRLFHDILAKNLFVKAGSFDAVTRKQFMLMTAITFDVKINWSTLFFGVLKAMVTPGSRQAKGFAIQIGVVLSKLPGLALGEPRAFPPPRVLNEKTVQSFVHINEQVGVEKTTGSPPMKKTPKKRAVSKKRPVDSSPPMKKTPKKRAVSKKRPVDSDAEVSPIVKKKRTTKSKPAAAKRLPVEEPVSTTSEQPVAEVATCEREPVAEVTTGDADASIEQVLAQLDLVFKELDVERGDRNETWFDRALDEELENANQEIQDSEDEKDFDVDIQELPVLDEIRTVLEAGVKADTDSFAIRSKFNALDAKLLLLDGQVAAIRSEQLEFQAKISADLLNLSTQIGDIVDYIRGGDAKKGEGSSIRRPLPTPVRVERRPLPTPKPPPDVQGSGKSLSVEQAAEFVCEADRRESDRLERERARERRERSLSRSGSYKRGRRQ
ncbi:hypothetical protein F511_33075 [Dorcoceras hygrometricum]|uniref:Dystroglycan-like n=1 Tax=Dorcoceras hygrometricum TaxID=472368 RepID=A0A2Z7BV90_9LAMI|nr:hypothetical protein F511_33075 [Dorcoceras hygrometricum]